MTNTFVWDNGLRKGSCVLDLLPWLWCFLLTGTSNTNSCKSRGYNDWVYLVLIICEFSQNIHHLFRLILIAVFRITNPYTLHTTHTINTDKNDDCFYSFISINFNKLLLTYFHKNRWPTNTWKKKCVWCVVLALVIVSCLHVAERKHLNANFKCKTIAINVCDSHLSSRHWSGKMFRFFWFSFVFVFVVLVARTGVVRRFN